MRRFWPVAVALLVASGVMYAGITLFHYLPRLFPKASGQEMLTNWVADNTGATLSAGYAVPLFYPGLGIQIRDVELKIPDGHGSSTLFAARAIKIVADRRQLLDNRKVVVRQIILDRPRIYLSRDAAGAWNVSQWLKNRKKQPPPDPEKMGFWKWLVRDTLNEMMPTADTDVGRLIANVRVRLIDAEVRVVDGKRKLLQPIHLSRVNLDLNGGALSLALPFPQYDGEGGDRLRVRGSLRATGKHNFSIAGLTLDWPGLTIHSLSGSVNAKPLSFDARLDATCSYPAFKRVAMWGPIARSGTIPDTEGSGTGRVRVHVWGPEKKRAAKVHYTGTVALENFSWDPGRVIAPISNINATLALNDGEVLLPETTVTIGGMPITGKMRMIESRDPTFIIDAHADTIDFQRLFKKSRHQDPPGTPLGRMRTNWGGSARLKNASYGKMVATDVEGEWKVTTQRYLTFPRLRFRACGGNYVESGRTYVDYNHRSEIFFRFDGRVRNVDITQFTDQIFNTTTFLHGTAETEGYITGKFVNGKLSYRSIYGVLPVKVRDGYFAGYNFIGEIFKVFGAAVPPEYKGQHFSRMTATIDLTRAVAIFQDMKVDGYSLKAGAKGWIDFPGHTCDIKLEVQLLKPVWGLLKAVPLLGVITGPIGEAITTMYVRVFGRWDKMQYAPYNPLESDAPNLPATVGIDEGSTASPAPGGTVDPPTSRRRRPR